MLCQDLIDLHIQAFTILSTPGSTLQVLWQAAAETRPPTQVHTPMHTDERALQPLLRGLAQVIPPRQVLQAHSFQVHSGGLLLTQQAVKRASGSRQSGKRVDSRLSSRRVASRQAGRQKDTGSKVSNTLDCTTSLQSCSSSEELGFKPFTYDKLHWQRRQPWQRDRHAL